MSYGILLREETMISILFISILNNLASNFVYLENTIAIFKDIHLDGSIVGTFSY